MPYTLFFHETFDITAMIQDAVAVIPDDSSVEIMETVGKSASSAVYKDLIGYCDQEISIALLGQNLTTEVKGGSYAAAESHMQVRKDIIDADKKLIEKTFNTLIKWIYKLNFADGDMPQFMMYEEEDVDKDLAERDEKLTASMEKSGLKLSKRYYQKNYGLEEEDLIENGTIALSENDHSFKAVAPSPRRTVALSLFPDQQAIDDAVDSLSPEELQKQMEQLLKPIIKLIQDDNSYDEIMEKLIETYPDMDSKAIEEMLARAIFVSEVWGILNARRD